MVSLKRKEFPRRLRRRGKKNTQEKSQKDVCLDGLTLAANQRNGWPKRPTQEARHLWFRCVCLFLPTPYSSASSSSPHPACADASAVCCFFSSPYPASAASDSASAASGSASAASPSSSESAASASSHLPSASFPSPGPPIFFSLFVVCVCASVFLPPPCVSV